MEPRSKKANIPPPVDLPKFPQPVMTSDRFGDEKVSPQILQHSQQKQLRRESTTDIVDILDKRTLTTPKSALIIQDEAVSPQQLSSNLQKHPSVTMFEVSDSDDNGPSNNNQTPVSNSQSPPNSQKSKSASQQRQQSEATLSADQSTFYRRFPELSDDLIVAVASCALEREVMWHGKALLTEKHLCFYGKIFTKAARLAIKWRDILSIEKKNSAGVFPNAIKITTLNSKYTLSSFAKRDFVHVKMMSLWEKSLSIAESTLSVVHESSSSIAKSTLQLAQPSMLPSSNENLSMALFEKSDTASVTSNDSRVIMHEKTEFAGRRSRTMINFATPQASMGKESSKKKRHSQTVGHNRKQLKYRPSVVVRSVDESQLSSLDSIDDPDLMNFDSKSHGQFQLGQVLSEMSLKETIMIISFVCMLLFSAYTIWRNRLVNSEISQLAANWDASEYEVMQLIRDKSDHRMFTVHIAKFVERLLELSDNTRITLAEIRAMGRVLPRVIG